MHFEVWLMRCSRPCRLRLIKKSEKRILELENKKEQLERGQRIAFLSTLLVFALALLKAFTGYLFNSPLLMADAWHSGADILINFSSLIGLKLASQKKSSRFPYGLYRAETIATLLIGGMILLVGSDLIADGWHRFFLMESHTAFPGIPILVSAISSALSLFLAIKQRAIGRAIGSQALLATAREAFFDIFTSLFVLAGMVFVFIRVPYIEGFVIILIAVLIIKLGFETAWNAILILMDANLDQELILKVKQLLADINGVSGVEGVAVRQSGPYKTVNCTIKTSPSLKVYQSHTLADIAENLLLEKYQSIESVFVHIEPEKESIKAAVIPVEGKKGLDALLFDEFGKAPYFMRLKIDRDHVEIESYIENQYLNEKTHIGLNAAKSILVYQVNLLFVSQIGEISFHMLKNHYVDIFKAEPQMKAGQIIDLYIKNRLHPILQPNRLKSDF